MWACTGISYSALDEVILASSLYVCAPLPFSESKGNLNYSVNVAIMSLALSIHYSTCVVQLTIHALLMVKVYVAIYVDFIIPY